MTEPRPSSGRELQFQPEWYRVTLASIGDAVITADTKGRITFLNPVAESLTGWTLQEARAQPLEAVFHIVNEESRQPVESPTIRALREGLVVGLANHSLLIAKDRTERPIDDSAAPIRNDKGEVTGVVLVFRDISERKRQEKLVQDALAYADNIIATLREPFLVLDKSLQVVTANRAFFENFHVTPNETQSRFVYDLGNHQWDIPKLRTLLEDVLPRNHVFDNFEVEHEFPIIGRKTMLLNARRIRKPGNNSELILLAIEDITDRKEAEAATLRLAAIVNSSDDAIISKTLDGVIMSWNRAAERMFGYTAAEAIGQSIRMIIPPNRQDEEEYVLSKLRNGESIEHFETVRMRKDKTQFDVSLTVSPIMDQAGHVIGGSKIARDITDRKRAKAALEQSEVKYRRLFETAQDAILILDARTGKITDANPFIQDLLGYSHADFVGKDLWQLGIFSDKEAIQSGFQRLQREGYIRFENLPLETKGGHEIDVEFVSNVYEVDHQSVIQCNIRDIRERVRLEKQTKAQAEALADLHRRKDEFLAMLSHELRNPLAPIANAVQLLRLGKNEDQFQQEARTVIERQVGQLKRLIDDLMEVSRITTGRIRLNREQVDVRGLVERAIEAARPSIDQQKHELTTSLPSHPVWLNADASRLEQVLVNLITNAAKYTEPGGHIWLTAEQQGNEAVLRVRDNGVGISPELLPHLFDLFSQADRTLDRSQGGLGIGLSLVQRLVELHGGTVAADSALGRGSEFVVRLPVKSATPKSPTPSHGAALSTGPSLRVLVVDDNLDMANTIGMLLQASGHDVRIAHDGPTALELALEFRPQVVLLDIGLPRLDGYQVVKRMRAHTDLKSAMIVAMTGYDQESDRGRSVEAGFDHHLVKPPDLVELQRILASASAKAI